MPLFNYKRVALTETEFICVHIARGPEWLLNYSKLRYLVAKIIVLVEETISVPILSYFLITKSNLCHMTTAFDISKLKLTVYGN